MPLLSDTSAVFVGRRDQLRLLTDQADRVRSGPPEMLLVGGDAGVGKSRLVNEFTATRPSGTVFTGACLQLGVDGLSYAPFTAVLRQVLRECGRTPFEEAAPGGIGEFARLLPELGPIPEERRENRGILFEQLLRLFTLLAGDEGATVVLEDLHWADGATRDLLVFLVRNLDRPGTQIVATFRSDDLHRAHPLRRLLPELERLPGVGRIQLEPLSREEVAVQARAIRGEDLAPAELDSLYRRSEGVPLFVEALATADTCPTDEDSDLPDHFRDLLLEPLNRFDDTAWTVLRAAAVGAVSVTVEHQVLYHAAGLPESELEAALHTLVDANVLRAGQTGYRFRHALLRDAVHGEILPGPHARLHLRFAQLIDEYPNTVPADRRAAEEAHHYQAAHDMPRALQAAWWAAVRAGETLAFNEELTMLERVLELWDQVPDAAERTQGHTRPKVVAKAAGGPWNWWRRPWPTCRRTPPAMRPVWSGPSCCAGVAMPAYAASIAALTAEVEGEDTTDLWKSAVVAWEAVPMPLHLARARLREAEVVAAGDRDLAVRRVRQVHETAVECGAVPLARAAEGLARRLGTGVTEQAAPPVAPAGLTARESEVLRLLAEGATNAQIAERLFISPKTASVHVSNILTKLDVPNHATAGARARRLGLA